MARFVLSGSDSEALCIAEAASPRDARLWGYRHLAKVPRFSGGVEPEDAFYERTRAPLLESFRARYLSEGASKGEAERMAQTAVGARPVLPVVQVPAQEPMLRSGAKWDGVTW